MAQNLKINILAQDKTKQALNSVKGGLAKVRSAVFSLQSAFIGLGAGLVIKNLVSTGKELENLRVRLKFLLKDTNEGAKAFDNMVKFASKVPFSLEEIQSGSGILATVTDNADDLQKMLEITGNVAATTGLDFRTAAEQIQRSFSAGIGAADLFREKGVRNMLGFKAGATVSIEDTVKAFERVFGKSGRFGRATDELAETFDGTLSMIGDKVFNFKKVILEAGFFEALKSDFNSLDKFLAQNSKQLDEIAQKIGRSLGFAVHQITKSIIILKDNLSTIKTFFQILIAIKVVTLFSKLAMSIMNAAKAMAAFGLSTTITKGGLLGLAKLVAKGGAIFVAFKGLDEIFDGMVESFEEFDHKITTSTLPRSRDIAKVQHQINKELLFAKEAADAIARAKEKEAKLNSFINEQMIKNRKQFNELVKKGLEEQSEKELFIQSEVNKKRLKFHELEKEGVKQFEKQRDILGQVGEKIKENNDSFSLSNEIFSSITSFTSSFSRSLAEAIVLGKNLNKSFAELAKGLLVDILAKTIERLALLAIEEFIVKKIIGKDNEKLRTEKAITKEKQKQVALQALLMFMGGGGGGSGFKLFNKGGSVRKNEPVIVGDSASGRGGELFVPNSSGQIIPNSRLGSGGGVNVNFNINAVDASGFEDLLVRSRGTITQLINNAVNEKGRSSII